MHDVMSASSTANIVALEEILAVYDTPFRNAVRKILLDEGFDLGAGLPNLQLAREIREALGWSLSYQGFDKDWESLRLFFEWADHQGVLVDFSAEF